VTILVSIEQEVAAWQVPAGHVDRIRQALPQHDIRYATSPEARAEALRDCECLFTWILGPDELAQAPRLRWVHSSAVAVGTLCLAALAERGIAVTNSRGIQATPIAEHVLALMLAMTRRLPLALARQREARWAQHEFEGPMRPLTLRGRCLGIVGLGSIGSEVARLGAALGMDVVAVRRDPTRAVPAGVRAVWGPEDLDRLLAASDIVVVATPLTGETAALFDATRVSRMRRGARLINIARGPLVDGAALAAALRSGHLAGAALDVVEREPLPADDPLWTAPNLIITPHTSGYRPDHWDDVVALFVDNVRRWDAGQPLVWPVDPVRGY
jgi:phosphoglycerate dehydrogenase-like enzyme